MSSNFALPQQAELLADIKARCQVIKSAAIMVETLTSEKMYKSILIDEVTGHATFLLECARVLLVDIAALRRSLAREATEEDRKGDQDVSIV